MHSTDVLACPAVAGTQTMSVSAGIACDVRAPSPFDRLHAEEERRKAQQTTWTKDKSKRTPRQKAPRMELFRCPVNVPEEVGNYRAELCAWAGWLPPHLSSVMKGAVCASDVGGEGVRTSHEAISAYTHTPGIQQRYKCQPVSPFQVEYNLPTLARMGLVTTISRKRYDSWDRQFKTEFLLEITDENISNLEAFYLREKDAKAAREAEKAERQAAAASRRNRYKRDERARLTVVEFEGSNSRHTTDTESGTESNTESATGHIAYANQVVPSKVAKASSSSDPGSARDDEPTSPEGQDRGGQAPHTPEDRDESWHRARDRMAGHLGVDPAEIGRNAMDLAHNLSARYGEDAVVAAAQRCTYQTVSPVGFFVTAAESLCVKFTAAQRKHDEQRERDEQEKRAENEINSWLPRFEAVGVSDNFFRSQIKEFRRNGRTDEEILDRLPKWLAKMTAKHAERVAAEAEAEVERRENERIHDEYADKFHGGKRRAAHRHAYNETDGRNAEVYAYMRKALETGVTK
jgi:hypothetical protein